MSAQVSKCMSMEWQRHNLLARTPFSKPPKESEGAVNKSGTAMRATPMVAPAAFHFATIVIKSHGTRCNRVATNRPCSLVVMSLMLRWVGGGTMFEGTLTLLNSL